MRRSYECSTLNKGIDKGGELTVQPKEDLSTRETILHLFKTNDELTAKELTDRLSITSMAVRRHIDALERDGFIEARTIRQPMGRPTATYHLTERSSVLFPNKYHTVALDLLDELVQETGEDMVERLFERRKEKLFKRYSSAMENKSFHEKVSLLAELQNDNGYMVEWKQIGEDDYELVEYNCPISQIANQYNHACQCELQLFESLLEAEISRPDCLAQGGRKCLYKIQRRSQES
ncbi:helix-turn-helix transcriptional regulator [Paenibacillus sp. NPDC057934]|uniref:helix-turn-helix transcriptional regulator n=1 Tax=Paenibacillus sp. NPDC057934 TaxID=3346282 RepID=UPI0036DE2580